MRGEAGAIEPMHSNISIGRFLISPLTRELDNGRFAASVSIRSGRGRSTHDRVMRLAPTFDSASAAAMFAAEAGLSWARDPARA
jgi:hypothetical protein